MVKSTDFPKQVKFILASCDSKEEVSKKCAYWLLSEDIWPTVEPVYPPEKPVEAITYESLSKKEKEELVDKAKEDFFDTLNNYYDQQWYAFWHNKLMIQELKRLRFHLKEDDYAEDGKITDKIGEYKNAIVKIGSQMINKKIRKEYVEEEVIF